MLSCYINYIVSLYSSKILADLNTAGVTLIGGLFGMWDYWRVVPVVIS